MDIVKDSVNVKVYELIDQQPSTFILEGTENNVPQHLTAPALGRIPPISSRMKAGKSVKGVTWERIRYIKGCPTIVESEQKAQNWEPNDTTGADDIYFLAGKLFAFPEMDPQLVEFLDSCNANISNKSRKSDTTPLFKELTQEQSAKDEVEVYLVTQRVMDYLRDLAMKEPDGTFKYNQNRIDNLCSLFAISGYDESQYLLKFKAIYAYAIDHPTEFLRKVSDANAEKLAMLRQALELGILQWDGDQLTWSENKKVVLTTKANKEDDRLKEAVDFLLSGEGTQSSIQLELSVKYKREQRLQMSSN